jgi:hypothetical protein
MTEFSPDGYRKMLLGLREAGYHFQTFQDLMTMHSPDVPYIVLRHDIDVDLECAIGLARIEHEQGIQSTFFVSLRSPFYNLLSSSNSRAVQHIHQLGHDLGVHVDLSIYGTDYSLGISEAEVVARFLPHISTSLISVHHPGQLIHLEKLMQIESIRNVYGLLLSGEMDYLSDSTGRWRYGHPLDSDAFRNKRPIQILTHPIWWMLEGRTPMLKLKVHLEDAQVVIVEHAKEYLPTLFELEDLED